MKMYLYFLKNQVFIRSLLNGDFPFPNAYYTVTIIVKVKRKRTQKLWVVEPKDGLIN